MVLLPPDGHWKVHGGMWCMALLALMYGTPREACERATFGSGERCDLEPVGPHELLRAWHAGAVVVLCALVAALCNTDSNSSPKPRRPLTQDAGLAMQLPDSKNPGMLLCNLR